MSPATTRSAGAALALLFLVGPGLGHAEEAGAAVPAASSSADPAVHPRLTLDLPANAVATGGMLLLAGLSQFEANKLAPSRCRWCDPPQIDRWARRELRWSDRKMADTVSGVLTVALPAGLALTLALSPRPEGARGREVAEDLLMLTETASAAVLLSQAAKLTTARLRPEPWSRSGGGDTSAGNRMSFWAGHSAFAFSLAAGATQVARMRGLRGWRWLAVASFAGAAASGWLRIAADRHWLTDVVVGAGVGTAVGLAVPPLVLRPAGERKPAVTLVPVPGGLALLF
jgi:hypothetical protein